MTLPPGRAALSADAAKKSLDRVSARDYSSLPPDLPVPEDDGAADHLPGSELPSLSLPIAGGGSSLRPARPGTLVAFVYPRTGTPGQPLVPGWDDIPGARGCTPQSCAFRDRTRRSPSWAPRWSASARWTRPSRRRSPSARSCPTRSSTTAAAAARRARPADLRRGRDDALQAPHASWRATGRIEKVFYPVFPPDRNAADVVDYWRGPPGSPAGRRLTGGRCGDRSPRRR